MTVTKNNVRDLIESYLKDNKIKYTTNYEDSKGLIYEIYVGSLECTIQVEYDLDNDEDNYIVLQLFTQVGKYDGRSLYHQDWDNENKFLDSIEDEIEQLIDATKKLNAVINKIRNKIEQIQEICDENELDINEFISLNYDFD
jgi:hypothetical protein